jgi:hypothetical protein
MLVCKVLRTTVRQSGADTVSGDSPAGTTLINISAANIDESADKSMLCTVRLASVLKCAARCSPL